MQPTLKLIRSAMKHQPPLEQVGSGLTSHGVNALSLNRRSAEQTNLALNGPLQASIKQLSQLAKSPVFTKQLMDLKPPPNQYMTSEQFAK